MSEPTTIPMYREATTADPVHILMAVVPVERCEHGNIDPHWFMVGEDTQGYAVPVMCPGAGIGDNDDECVDCGHHYDQHQPHCRLCRCAGIGDNDE